MDEKYSAGQDKEVEATLEEDTGGGNEQPLLTIEIEQTIERKGTPDKAGKTGKGGVQGPTKKSKPKPPQGEQKKDTPAANNNQADNAEREKDNKDNQEKDKQEKDKEPKDDEKSKGPKDENPDQPKEEKPKEQPQEGEEQKKNYDDYKDMVADDEFTGDNFNEGHPDKSHPNAGEGDDRDNQDTSQNTLPGGEPDEPGGEQGEDEEDEEEDGDEEKKPDNGPGTAGFVPEMTARGNPKFNLKYLEHNWKLIMQKSETKMMIRKASFTISNSLSVACVGLDYVLWFGLWLVKPPVINPNTRLEGLVEMVLFDPGIAAAVFGIGREFLDRLLMMVQSIGEKIVEIVERIKKAMHTRPTPATA